MTRIDVVDRPVKSGALPSVVTFRRHAGSTTVPRPQVAACLWEGVVEPLNGVEGDWWINGIDLHIKIGQEWVRFGSPQEEE